MAAPCGRDFVSSPKLNAFDIDVAAPSRKLLGEGEGNAIVTMPSRKRDVGGVYCHTSKP